MSSQVRVPEIGTNVGQAFKSALKAPDRAFKNQPTGGAGSARFDRRQFHPTYKPQPPSSGQPQQKPVPAPQGKGQQRRHSSQPRYPLRLEVLGQVPLEPIETVLVKFGFFEDTHVDLIPADVVLSPWLDRQKVLGKAFRDEGVQPIAAKNLSLGVVRRGLTNQGFYLADVSMYEKQEPDLFAQNSFRRKLTVTLHFQRGSRESVAFKGGMTKDLRHLANVVWKDIFVWDNYQKELPLGAKADPTVTINCRSPYKSGNYNTTRALAIREGKICVVDVETVEEKA